MKVLETKINELKSMILEGKIMDVFEKFYHDDVGMRENAKKTTICKESNRKKDEEFVSNVTEFRSAQVLDVATGHNVTMEVWHHDYTHKEWSTRQYTQAAVQTWKEGKIIKKQFFYGN